MSERLTPYQLQELQENAEFGDLDHSTVSKRQTRILTALHFILGTNNELASLPYTNMPTILILIELFFGKKYTTESLKYWIEDLVKRDYIAVYDENKGAEENFFSLTETGIALFMHLYETRESLFESNSRNSLAFMH